MAIVKIGAPLTGIRGTIGGITFSANGSGPYAKQWASGPNPRSPNQMAQRASLAGLNAEWRDLTPVQKTAWDTFAALPAQDLTNSLGETYSASGFNWFVKCNSRLDRVGRAHIVAVPAQARPAAPTITDFRITRAGSNPDLCNGGVASADSQEGILAPANAFDNSTVAASVWQPAAPAETGWLEYALPATKIIRQYNFFGYLFLPTINPADWNFQYWDGGAWQTVDTITAESWPGGSWHTFFLSNQVTATRWRFLITANQGFLNALHVNEVEMKAADKDASVIIYPEDEFDDAPNYDLILHISQGNTTGPQVMYPNFLEVVATQTPGRTYVEFQSELEATFGTIFDLRSWFCRLYRQTREGLRSAPDTARTESI